MTTLADEDIADEPTHKTPIADRGSVKRAVFDAFREDDDLLRCHNVQPHELEALSRVAMLGSVRTKSDLIFMLNAIRRARRK